MNVPRTITALAIAASVCGCGTIRSAREAQRRVEADASARASARVDLNGFSLARLVDFALTNRPSMVSAALAVKDARLAMKEIAADAPLASETPWNALGADVSMGYSERSVAKHLEDFEFKTKKGKGTGSLSVDLLVYDFGRNAARARAQAENVLAAESALAQEGFLVCDEVSAAYFALLRNDALLEVAATNVAMYAEHLKRAEDRLSLGEAMELDVLRARLDLATARESLVSASNDVATAGAELMSALGVDASSGDCAEVFAVRPGSLARAVRNLSDTAGTSAELYDFGATNAPALVIARAKLRAASAQVDYAVADMMPNLSASASLNWTDPLWYWQWGVSAFESLFTGFRRTTAVDRAVVAMESAASAVESEELSLSRSLELAVAERDSARASLAASVTRVKEARRNLDTVAARYGVGDVSRVDFTDAVSDHADALGNRVRAFYRGQIAEAHILKLVGSAPDYHEEVTPEEEN